MKLDFINLNDLKISPVNVRKHGEKSGDDLVSSIKANGVIQPLLVRPNCDGYEVIAGQRRYNACLAIAEQQEVSPLPCAIMEDGDDAKAIEASLAENIARLPMDEIDQYEAFLSLTKQGRTIEDIASHFGVTERLVKQRLAIANLYAPILNAYRRDKIEPSTIRLLTMASARQQKDWFKLFKSDDEHTPTGHYLKRWLFGGEEIPTANALFDLKSYSGVITSDLFGEDSYFADPGLFWEHQSQAIAEMKSDLEDEGWCEVILLDVGEHWNPWGHTEVSKEEGGKVYIQVRSDGEVIVHEGLLSEKEAKRLASAKAGKEAAKPEHPELTKSMQNYLALHRHATVRTELLGHADIALRLAVAQMISGSRLWEVHAEPQKANTEAIKDSLAANKAESAFAAERAEVRRLLGIGDEQDDTLVYRKEDWDKSHDFHAVFAKLLSLSDAEVMNVLTFVVAETLPSGSEIVEILGKLLGVDMAEHWQPDDTFFDLLKDKEAINAMLGHIAGKRVADGNLTATAKVQKQIIRDCLSGKRSSAKKDWQPRYMRFPMKGYTKRDGIEAVKTWSSVKEHYKAAL